MSVNRFHLVAIVSWLAAVAGMVVAGLALGIPPTTVSSVLVFLAAVLPPLVLVAVFRGAPPATIAQVLYDTDRNTDRTRGRDRMSR